MYVNNMYRNRNKYIEPIDMQIEAQPASNLTILNNIFVIIVNYATLVVNQMQMPIVNESITRSCTSDNFSLLVRSFF